MLLPAACLLLPADCRLQTADRLIRLAFLTDTNGVTGGEKEKNA